MGALREIACGSFTAAYNTGGLSTHYLLCWKDQLGKTETRKKLTTAAAAEIGRIRHFKPPRRSYRVIG